PRFFVCAHGLRANSGRARSHSRAHQRGCCPMLRRSSRAAQHQNLSLAVTCKLRIGFVAAGSPNVLLFSTVTQVVYVTWFSGFVASTRTSRFFVPISRNVRAS